MSETINITPEVAAMNTAIKHCADKGIKSGLKGKQHAAILTKWAFASEEQSTEYTFAGFVVLENGSALRQKLEKAGHISKTETLEETWM